MMLLSYHKDEANGDKRYFAFMILLSFFSPLLFLISGLETLLYKCGFEIEFYGPKTADKYPRVIGNEFFEEKSFLGFFKGTWVHDKPEYIDVYEGTMRWVGHKVRWVGFGKANGFGIMILKLTKHDPVNDH